jgi:hypothetical protein
LEHWLQSASSDRHSTSLHFSSWFLENQPVVQILSVYHVDPNIPVIYDAYANAMGYPMNIYSQSLTEKLHSEAK